MKQKQSILDHLNKIIIEEKGKPVTINSMFIDSELDSLGTILTIAFLEADFPIFKDFPSEEDALLSLDIPNLTIRELIKKCILSITNTSKEQNKEKDI